MSLRKRPQSFDSLYNLSKVNILKKGENNYEV